MDTEPTYAELVAALRGFVDFLQPAHFLDYEDGTPMDSCVCCHAESLADESIPHLDDCLWALGESLLTRLATEEAAHGE